jgi:hypothetical protein
MGSYIVGHSVLREMFTVCSDTPLEHISQEGVVRARISYVFTVVKRSG